MFELIERKEIYKGRIFDVTEDTVMLPNGEKGVYSRIFHNGASAVIAVDGEDRIIFVRQFRVPCDGEFLEIPAGRLEKGEDPLDGAKRELEEETGYVSESINYFIKLHLCVGYSNEVIYYFIAKGLIPGSQNLDEDEFVTVERYTAEQAADMIKSGMITDAKTVAGVLAYLNSRTNHSCL